MQDKTPFKTITNVITWEDELSIPENIKYLRGDWNAHEFYLAPSCLTRNGLGQEYSVYGGKLYEHSKEDGLKASDFTGEFVFGDYFITETGDFHVSFKVLVFKGEIKEIGLHENKRSDDELRKKLTTKLSEKVRVRLNRENKLWFRFLYAPWRFVWRNLFSLLTMILKAIHIFFFVIVRFLTPW